MSSSVQGHSARVHKDFRSKTRTTGFKMKQGGTTSFGSSKSMPVNGMRNPGLIMPLHPNRIVRTPEPMNADLVDLKEWIKGTLKADIRRKLGLQKVLDIMPRIEQWAMQEARQRFAVGVRVLRATGNRFRD